MKNPKVGDRVAYHDLGQPRTKGSVIIVRGDAVVWRVDGPKGSIYEDHRHRLVRLKPRKKPVESDGGGTT